MRKERVALVLALALAAGCVIVRKDPSPWAGTLYRDVKVRAEQKPEQARIYFYQYARRLFHRSQDLLLDGVRLGQSVNQRYFFIDVAPGPHKVTSPADKDGLYLEVAAGEVKYVRCFFDNKPNVPFPPFTLEVVTAEKAEADLVGRELRFALEEERN